MEPLPFSPPGRYGGGSPFVNPVCGHWSCPLTVAHHHCTQCGYGDTELEQLKLHACRRPYVPELAPPPPPPPAFFRPPAPAGYYRPAPADDREYDQLAGRPLFPPAGFVPGQYFPPPPPGAPLYPPPPPPPAQQPQTISGEGAAPLDFSSERRAVSPPRYAEGGPPAAAVVPGAGIEAGPCYGAGYWLPEAAEIEPGRSVAEGTREAGSEERVERPSCQVEARVATERHRQHHQERQRHDQHRHDQHHHQQYQEQQGQHDQHQEHQQQQHDQHHHQQHQEQQPHHDQHHHQRHQEQQGQYDQHHHQQHQEHYDQSHHQEHQEQQRHYDQHHQHLDQHQQQQQPQQEELQHHYYVQEQHQRELRHHQEHIHQHNHQQQEQHLLQQRQDEVAVPASISESSRREVGPPPSPSALAPPFQDHVQIPPIHAPVQDYVPAPVAHASAPAAHASVPVLAHAPVPAAPVQVPAVEVTDAPVPAAPVQVVPAVEVTPAAPVQVVPAVEVTPAAPVAGEDEEDQEPATVDVETADDQLVESPAGGADPARPDPDPSSGSDPNSGSNPDRNSGSNPDPISASNPDPNSDSDPGSDRHRSPVDSGDDTSLSPINVDLEVLCLICSTRINLQLDQYCDIYLDNIVTAHSRLAVPEKLGRVLRYHFSPELLYSHTLCRRCFNIINGIDQLEGRLDQLRSEVRNKFSITCRDRGLHPHHFPARPDSTQPVERAEDGVPGPPEPGRTAEHEARADTGQTAGHPTSAERDTAAAAADSAAEPARDTDKHPAGGRCRDAATETVRRPVADTAVGTSTVAGMLSCEPVGRECGTQTSPPALPWLCRRCGRAFRYRSALRRHSAVHQAGRPQQRQQHQQPAPLRCPGCRCGLESRAALLAHVCAAAATVARPRCTQCGREFRQRRNMLAHRRLCTETEMMECQVCGLRLRGRDAYRRHQMSHQQNHPLKCSVCDKGFVKPSDLKRHERTHDKVKSHVCETCGKQFSTASNYNQHVAKVHQATKVFKCTECPKSFSYRSSLQLHMKTHGGEKVFTCERCGKTFLYKNNLMRHLKVHSGVRQEVKCNKCNEVFANKSSLKAHSLTCF